MKGRFWTLIPSRRVNRVAVIASIAGVTVLAIGLLLLRRGDAQREEPRAEVTAEPPMGAATAAPSPRPTPPPPEPARSAVKRSALPATAETTRATPPPAETGSLRIVSDVPGAQVFLDRQFIGATPVTANDLKPGTYQLNVSAQGFESHVEGVEVATGSREVSVNFRTVRLDASLDVIHKHRMGSCRGRLIATPTGLRYDTSDKDDVFTAALTDIETFQVDYLNKNLRIQPRRGKRYDFTDPDGNADRLFVFHRDVEQARDRLKQGASQ